MIDRWRIASTVLVLVGTLTTVEWAGAQAAPPQTSKTTTKLSDDELRAFADDLARAVSSKDAKAFNERIDWDTILQEATDKIEVSPNLRKGFCVGAKSGIEKSLAGALIQNAQGEPRRFHLLRIHEGVTGELSALFRLLPAAGGLSYAEFTPRRRPDGKIRATGIYVFLSGETIAQTIRRAYLPVVQNENRTALSRILGQTNEFAASLDKIGDLATAIREKRFKDAMTIYKALPQSVREDKTVLILKLGATQFTDEAEYAETIQEFRKRFPKDACIDLISIAGYFMKKQYKEARESVDRLDALVGGDPYLDVYRANFAFESGDLKAAERSARRAITREPDLIEGYDSLLTIAAKQEHFDDLVKILDTLRDQFQLQFHKIADQPIYANFLKSPQYQAWIKAHPDQAEAKADQATPAGGDARP